MKHFFRKIGVQVSVLVLMVLAVYENSLTNSFLLDDHIDLWGPSGVVHKSFKDILLHPQGNFYRPLGPLFYRLCYLFSGHNPLGYHIANLCLFVIIVLLFYWIILLLSNDRRLAFFASLLFGLHPFQGMLVNYTVASALSTYVLFLQLACACLILFLKNGRRVYYGVSLLCFGLAMLAHEISLMFPVYACLLLYFWQQASLKKLFRWSAPYFLLAAAFLFFRWQIHHIQSSPQGLSLFLKYPGVYGTALANLVFWYVSKLVLPHQVLFLWAYDFPFGSVGLQQGSRMPWDVTVSFQSVAWAFVVIGGIGLIGYFMRRARRPLWTFSLGLFIAGLFPSLYVCFNYFPLVNPMIEPHWFYFSSTGFFILFAGGLLHLKTKVPFNVWGLILMVIIAGYFVSARLHNSRWRDQPTYCHYWIALNPHNNTPFRGIAYQAVERGAYARAVDFFRKSLRVSPDINARMLSAYGYALYGTGEQERALGYLRQAAAMDPQYALSHYYLGRIYLRQQRLRESRRAFSTAMRLNPHQPEYRRYVAFLQKLISAKERTPMNEK